MKNLIKIKSYKVFKYEKKLVHKIQTTYNF